MKDTVNLRIENCKLKIINLKSMKRILITLLCISFGFLQLNAQSHRVVSNTDNQITFNVSTGTLTTETVTVEEGQFTRLLMEGCASGVKNIGEPVEVLTRDGRKLKGTLTAADDNGFTLTTTVKERVDGKLVLPEAVKLLMVPSGD